MDKTIAGILAKIQIDLISGRGVQDIDLIRLRNLNKEEEVAASLQLIRQGEVLARYREFFGNEAKARALGEALEAREHFVRFPSRGTLDTFRGTSSVPLVQSELAKHPEYFANADRVFFAHVNQRQEGGVPTNPWSHPDSFIGNLFWRINMALTKVLWVRVT